MSSAPPILFLLDSESAFVFEPFKTGNHFVLSLEEWEQLDKSALEQYAAIVILAELDWSGKTLNDDYGFTIGLELRRKYKCLLPIVITSPMFQSFFELRALKDLQYNLLYARGTTFVPLIEIQENLKAVLTNLFPISLPVLTDMNEMLFNLRGVLSDTLGHRLRVGMSVLSFAGLMDDMKALLNTQQTTALNWEYYRKALNETLNDPQKFAAFKSQLLLTINNALPATDIAEQSTTSGRKHRLLLVEDDNSFAELAQENLSPYFEEIIYTNDAGKAIQLLKEDTGNSITGLLCDWRLYTGSSQKYWQMQGYEILNYAAKNRYAALFGITSLSDTNVHNIRNMLGFEMYLFKKEHFTGNNAQTQWKIMADLISQQCDAVAQLIASEPSGTAWLKVKEEYISRRNAGWSAYEAEISAEADSLFGFYKEAIARENTRNVFSINEMGLNLKNNLKNILIVRRVYLGLYFMLNQRNEYLQTIRPVGLLGDGSKTDTSQKHHAIDAYSIIRKDWWDDIEADSPSVSIEEEWEKYEQRQKNFRNALSIDISSLPKKGLLPEEKDWMLRNEIDDSFLFNYWTDGNY